MLVIGYPGIGKSSCCNKDTRFIDLESSNFIHDDGLNWAKSYVNVALDLHSQGFIVFLSSHYVVRDLLMAEFNSNCKYSNNDLLIIYPALELEDVWKERITKRLAKTKLSKDGRAYNRVLKYYETDITSLMNTPMGLLCPINAYALRIGSGLKADEKIDYSGKIYEYIETFDLATYIKHIIESNKIQISNINDALNQVSSITTPFLDILKNDAISTQ